MEISTFPHLIYVSPAGKYHYRRLAPLFGGKAKTVEIALEWAIEKEVPTDGGPLSGLQMHTHLSKDYKARYDAPTLGALLDAGLSFFASGHKVDEFSARKGLQSWGRDYDRETIRILRAKAFAERRDPREVIAETWEEAVRSLLVSNPYEVRTEGVDIPTNPESRALRALLNDRLGRPLDIDSLIDRRMAEIARRS